MKRLSDLFGEDKDEEEDGLWSLDTGRGGVGVKRKSEDKPWNSLLVEKRKEFVPSQEPRVVTASEEPVPSTSTNLKVHERQPLLIHTEIGLSDKVEIVGKTIQKKRLEFAAQRSLSSPSIVGVTNVPTPTPSLDYETSWKRLEGRRLEFFPSRALPASPDPLSVQAMSSTFRPDSERPIGGWRKPRVLESSRFVPQVAEINVRVPVPSPPVPDPALLTSASTSQETDYQPSQSQQLSEHLSGSSLASGRSSSLDPKVSEQDREFRIQEFSNSPSIHYSFSSTSTFDIGEYESPKRCNVQKIRELSQLDSTELWTEVAGRPRKKRRLGKELRSIVDEYDTSVRRFAQDYRLNKFDEDESMTLVIKVICGQEDKMIWTISNHVEEGVDRIVMFKPLYPYEIVVGVVLRIYQPWKEISLPNLPTPIILCTDFYRTGSKRNGFVGVTEEMMEDIMSTPVATNILRSINQMNVLDVFTTVLTNLVPYHLRNLNTIAKQMKRVKPWIDLDVVVHKMSFGVDLDKKPKFIFLLCDSDNFYSCLQFPSMKESKMKVNVSQVLRSGQYLKFRRLGVNNKTGIEENEQIFKIFRKLGSNQTIYYTLGLRHDTEWDVEIHLEVPYISLETLNENTQMDMMDVPMPEDIEVTETAEIVEDNEEDSACDTC